MQFLPVLALGLLLSGHSPQQVQRAVGEVLADQNIQSEYPSPQPASAPRSTSSAPGVGASLAQVLLWVLVGVVALLATLWLVQRLRGYRPDEHLADPPPAAVTSRAIEPLSLDEAQALAQAGRYDAALHALLLAVFQALDPERVLAGSLTSREILAEVSLGKRARGALEDLVAGVEVSLFGGRSPGATQFTRAVRACQGFFALHAGAGS